MRNALLGIATVTILAVVGYFSYQVWFHTFYFTVDRTDVNPSSPPQDDLQFVDDLLDSKSPVFAPTRIDRRDYEGWQINKSAAVIRLDCPDIRSDHEPQLAELYPSYADAMQQAATQQLTFLPSANLLDGLAKQFDDGLYAALDLACFEGTSGFAPAAVDLIEEMFTALPPESPARAFLAAALQLAARPPQLSPNQQAAADIWFAKFETDRARSQPISFYTWNADLGRVWKFFRFLQTRFAQSDLAVPADLATILRADPALENGYRQCMAFYAGLSNPADSLHLLQLNGAPANLSELAIKHSVPHALVSVLPPSTSRETELFGRLFASGSAAQSNLMLELLRRIRSGALDLTPRAGSGWYDHQTFALETLLLPARGAENQHLLLTAKYKRRLLQAFQALLTKRRETHARQIPHADAAVEMRPPDKIQPRLRLEPCATFYLRTARSYAFLESFLLSMISPAQLRQLHGFRKEGRREADLQSELAEIKELFYGFYLVACEDIGMAPTWSAEEAIIAESALTAATAWLAQLPQRDLAVDTRVSIPLLHDPNTQTTRLWATLGVRLAKLKASYARAPHIRENPESAWEEVKAFRLGSTRYVIAVDEFAEFSLPGREVWTRRQLRDFCDQHKNKSAILKALQH